jgi:hypothetical protein
VWRIQTFIQLSATGAFFVHIEMQRRGVVPKFTPFDVAPWPCLIIAIIAWRFWREGLLRRRAEACGYLVCDDCTYDLRGVETGVCPECGQAFTADTLKERWTEAGVRK